MWFWSFSLQALKLCLFSTCRSFSLNMTYPFYIRAFQSTFTFWKVSLKHFSTADQISCSAAYLGWACDGVACAWLGELRHWNSSWVISVVEGIVPLGWQRTTWNVHIQSHSEKWEKMGRFPNFQGQRVQGHFIFLTLALGMWWHVAKVLLEDGWDSQAKFCLSFLRLSPEKTGNQLSER